MAGRFSVKAVFEAKDRIVAPVARMQSRVGKFTRSMQRGFKRVNKGISNMTRGLKTGAMVALGGVAAIGGSVAAALTTMANKADALAKQSRQIGFPIEELQEWKFAAEQSGVSTELFDKSIGAFTKRLGEARAGTGALAGMLKKTNPALLDQLVATDDTAKAFEMYIDAMREAPTALDRAAMASSAFSRAGMKMASITDNSSAAIRALRKEQRENGVLTKQQANDAEAWNDAVNSLKLSITGLKDGAVAPLLKDLTKYARSVRELIIKNRELIGVKVKEYFMFIIDNFQTMVKWTKRVGIAIGVFIAFVAVLKTLALVMTAVNLVMSLNPIGLIVLGIAALIAAIAAVIVYWEDLKAAFLDLSGPAKAIAMLVTGPIGMLIGAAVLIQDAWEPIKTFFADLWTKITDVTGAVANVAMNLGSKIGGFFGFGKDKETDQQGADSAQVVTPQERVARSVEEQRSTSSAEVTIKDESGRAEVTGGKLGPGLNLLQTGAF